MNSYDITYVMTVEADDPLAAAHQMWEIMKTEPGPYLELKDADTGEKFIVDLEADPQEVEKR